MKNYNHEKFGTLKVVQQDGEIWFSMGCVAKALQIEDAVATFIALPDSYKTTIAIPDRVKKVAFIN